MAAHSAEDLLPHVGHDLECVTYSLKAEAPANVAVECETCGVVLLDFDTQEDED